MIKKIFKGILRRVFKTSVLKIHYLELEIDINKTLQLLEGFDLSRVKELSYDDFLLGNKEQFTLDKLAVLKDRFQSGEYKAYGIIEDGCLVYSAWLSLRTLGLPVNTNPIYLDDDEGYLEDAYCDPKARGRGLHNYMNNYRVMKIYEMGRHKAIVTVLDGNVPALKTQKKSGFQDLGCFYCGKLFGKEFNTLNKEKHASR